MKPYWLDRPKVLMASRTVMLMPGRSGMSAASKGAMRLMATWAMMAVRSTSNGEDLQVEEVAEEALAGQWPPPRRWEC